MAKKNNEEDPEEDKKDQDKKDQFDDDEDFGLPDLEYEELEDDDDDSDSDDSTSDDPFSEEKDVSGDSGDELEKELHEEIQSEADDDLFYEEESYDEFADSPEESEDPIFGSEEDPPASTSFDSGSTSSGYQPTYDTGDSGKGKFARIVVIGTLLFAVIAIVFWLVDGGGADDSDQELAQIEEQSKEIVPADTTPVVEEPVIEPEPAKPQPNQRQPGEITVLEQSTGKSYVIINSFFDGDLANDYATKLADEGKSPYIIPPFKNYRFHRVAIAEFDSFRDAKSRVEDYKAEYGQEVWPLRY